LRQAVSFDDLVTTRNVTLYPGFDDLGKDWQRTPHRRKDKKMLIFFEAPKSHKMH